MIRQGDLFLSGKSKKPIVVVWSDRTSFLARHPNKTGVTLHEYADAEGWQQVPPTPREEWLVFIDSRGYPSMVTANYAKTLKSEAATTYFLAPMPGPDQFKKVP